MTSKTTRFPRRSAVAAASLLALALAAAPPPALSAGRTVENNVQSMTSTVTVKSIDATNRRVVVADASGKTFAMKVPSSVRNFDQVKVGDRVRATYTVETELMISPINAPLPPDAETTLAARAAKGELPAGVVANHIVVTGAIIGIDMANHTLRIVSPQGGQVHTIAVRRADRQKAMANLKLGDKITAFVTESLMISVQPA
ncbi:MAG TPA: hypothetical protein VK801_13015 [Caulobacteraceae bacterium]|jgi:hypothetical protein|nr:hypothetical protein [Caulobacteraceae bacterium]